MKEEPHTIEDICPECGDDIVNSLDINIMICCGEDCNYSRLRKVSDNFIMKPIEKQKKQIII